MVALPIASLREKEREREISQRFVA